MRLQLSSCFLLSDFTWLRLATLCSHCFELFPIQCQSNDDPMLGPSAFLCPPGSSIHKAIQTGTNTSAKFKNQVALQDRRDTGEANSTLLLDSYTTSDMMNSHFGITFGILIAWTWWPIATHLGPGQRKS